MTLILSGTDGLSDIDGSAATPAVRGTDTNTGIFFGADTVGISTGGTSALSIDASQNITTTNKFAKASMPIGSVLQVLSTTKTDTFSSASTSFVDITGFSVSITPTSSSSKILVFGHITASAGIITVISGFAQLVRDSTAIGNGAYGIAVNAVGNNDFTTQFSFNYLDSPATTSATTYKIQFKGDTGTTWYINRPVNRNFACSSTITVMEVAA